MAVGKPTSSDQAQYNLPFSVAAYIVHNTLGPREVTGAGLTDPATLALMDKIVMAEDDTFNARFPAERWARAIITLNDGQIFTSNDTTAQGDWDKPLTDETLNSKYDGLTRDSGLLADFKRIKDIVWNLDAQQSVGDLLSMLCSQPKPHR